MHILTIPTHGTVVSAGSGTVALLSSLYIHTYIHTYNIHVAKAVAKSQICLFGVQKDRPCVGMVKFILTDHVLEWSNSHRPYCRVVKSFGALI